MGTSSTTETGRISSFRRPPFIAAEHPRDVADLPVEDAAAPPPGAAGTPEPGAPESIGPPSPGKSYWNWTWGLIGAGLVGAAGYGIVAVYQHQAGVPASVPTAVSRPPLNSTTALNAPHGSASPSSAPGSAVSAPAKGVAADGVPASGSVATAGSQPVPRPRSVAPAPDGAVEGTVRGATPAPADGPALPRPPEQAAVAAAQPEPSATEIMTPNRKIVASPMMGDDQRQVLDLMAATNSVVMQIKHQVDDGGKRMGEMQAQIDDMKRMVSLSQARLLATASEIAMGNIHPPPPSPVAPVDPPVAVPPPANSVEGACRMRPVYTVASASPRHVTLKGAGQSFIDLGPSDPIPCYGRIREITQEGSRWVVKTERDVIGRN